MAGDVFTVSAATARTGGQFRAAGAAGGLIGRVATVGAWQHAGVRGQADRVVEVPSSPPVRRGFGGAHGSGLDVHTVLVRCRINRLSHIDRTVGEPIRRYKHDYPGSRCTSRSQKLANSP